MPDLEPNPTRGFVCPACGRTREQSQSQLLRQIRRGIPWCCGQVMKVRGGPDSVTPPTEKRIGRRRPVLPGATAEYRRGFLGLGPDLAVGLVDLSEDGACVHLREPPVPGEEAELMLLRPLGGGRALKRRATVLWCRPAWGSGHLVEVLFVKRLTHAELATLAQ